MVLDCQKKIVEYETTGAVELLLREFLLWIADKFSNETAVGSIVALPFS